MLKCCIIEDVPTSSQLIENYINDTPGLEFAGCSVGLNNGINLVNRILPDLTFVNASMREISGIDLAKLTSSLTTVILITEDPDLALAAYDNEIFDYLLQPVPYWRFIKCLTNLKNIAKRLSAYSRENHFFIRTEARGKFIRINFSDIVYIEGALNYIHIHLVDGTRIKTYISLTDIYANLNPFKFTRIHRSYIINNDLLTEVNGNDIVMCGRASLTIGAAYKTSFFDSLAHKVIGAKKVTEEV
ncbi:hypothetical protein A0256_17625 [Mucilaginibacter sp. PAMC 26640]|nr:hypothetical protein A0256_17625 [Mucilaginibacter sp. PAMC 26640]